MQAKITSKLGSIYRIFEDRIVNGVWPVGRQIPTEHELAAEFKCSRSTVGKAIACLVHEGLVERRMSAGTRVIRNSVNRNKTPVQLDAFAIIYPSEKHEGVWRTVQAFHDAANEKNRRVVMLSTGNDYGKEAEIISRLSEFDVRGAVIHPVLVSPEDYVRFSQFLLTTSFPIVLVGKTIPGVNCPAVTSDGLDAGYTMTRHLLDRGLKKIGFFSDHAKDMGVRDRYQGYRWALKEAGISENPQWIFLEPSMKLNVEDPIQEPTRLALEYLRRAKDVEGVVCSHDFLAVGMVRAAKKLGRRVPRDLKVTGIDGHAIASTGDMPITTYCFPHGVTGRKAFEMLDILVSGGKLPSMEVQIKGELVIRSTT